MDKSLTAIYKIPFFISVTLTIIIFALSAAKDPFEMASIIIASLLAMFVLDFEYILNAYFLDTETDFSKTLVGFIKHSDWKNALKHIYYHRDESKENSLNSALFQMVLALMSVFVVFATTSVFAKTLILAVLAQSIYVLLEYYFKDRTDDWFWALKVKPNKQGVHTYIFVLLLVLSYCLYIF